jgi:hypothetical protein
MEIKQVRLRRVELVGHWNHDRLAVFHDADMGDQAGGKDLQGLVRNRALGVDPDAGAVVGVVGRGHGLRLPNPWLYQKCQIRCI